MHWHFYSRIWRKTPKEADMYAKIYYTYTQLKVSPLDHGLCSEHLGRAWDIFFNLDNYKFKIEF